MKNSILLDKNIVIDLIAGRPRRSKIVELLKNYNKLLISTHCFTTCFYILRKELPKEKLYLYLSKFELVGIDPSDCHLAFSIAQSTDDLEDCLELFTAKRNQAAVITADQHMIAKYGDLFELVGV